MKIANRLASPIPLLLLFLIVGKSIISSADIIAITPYENKPAISLKSLKLSGKQEQKEGIAFIEVDPDSIDFGKILLNMPLPSELGAHNIFYDRSMTRAYITVRGAQELLFFDLKKFPYRLKKIDLPGCKMGQTLVFSNDNNLWYLSCLMSQNVFIGKVSTNQIQKIITIPNSYPHGLVVMPEINRMLVTSSASADFSEKHDFFSVVELNTGKILENHKVSSKKSPAKVSPVSLLRLPNSDPPFVYISNMFGDELWIAIWNSKKMNFNVSKALDLKSFFSRTPLNLYFSTIRKQLFITSANPGTFHIFDISINPKAPKLIKSFLTAEGANNVAFTKDGRYGFVQNSLSSLPGTSDGSITVIDLKKQEVVSSIPTLKDKGLNPTSIVLLPEWNDFAGH